MFGQFLNIIVRSIKLDKTLYKDNKNFGEAAIYFCRSYNSILDGPIAGAVAANTVIKTARALQCLVWLLQFLLGLYGDFIYIM